MMLRVFSGLFSKCISNIYTHLAITTSLRVNGSKGVNKACDTDTDKEIRVPIRTGATTRTNGTGLSEV